MVSHVPNGTQATLCSAPRGSKRICALTYAEFGLFQANFPSTRAATTRVTIQFKVARRTYRRTMIARVNRVAP